MAVFIFWLHCLHVTLIFLLQVCDSSQVEPNLCDSSCSGFPAPDLSFQRGVRYTYRYSTTITTNLHGSNAGRNGLALDCVVDIDVVSKCHLMMQIRNPQIKRLSPQKEHSVQRLKSLRESLERTRLKFSLQGGKVTALCIQEGEQVWALNIQRAILSMLQTSHMSAKQELRKETDVYGMCTSSYKRQGPVLLKIRDLKRCHESRMANIWPHSVALTEDTSVQSELHCVQRHGTHVMEEVNCTEVSSMALWSNDAGLVRTQTVSVLRLLRAQPGTPSGADSLSHIVQTDLQFEEEGTAPPGKSRLSTPQQASQSLRMLCSLTSNPQQVSQEFLHLAFHLKHLTLSQLKTLWEEASFKCRNDWQPLLEALPVCGSENCVLLLTDLMRNRELEEEQAHTFLTTIALIPHPTPKTVNAINALLEVPEMWAKALLAGSSMVYQLCRKSHVSCSDLPPVQTLMRTLEETLGEGCEGKEPSRVFYALKSVGNTGLSAPALTPLLKQCVLGRSTALELRLAAIQAFRRFPCSADRSVLLQLYSSSQEDPEVRIAAYLQLMHCPDQNLFEVVKMTLRKETSSQVGSFVWSHLTNVLRSEDPMKQALIESLPDDIVSRDFEADFLKYSSYSDHTAASGLGIANLETSLIFSSKSFIPRSATANLTVYFHGRAHNLLEVDLHVENAEPLLRNIFGQQSQNPDGGTSAYNHKTQRTRRKTDESHGEAKEKCLSSTSSYLNQARAMLLGRRKTVEDRPKCWVGVKVFGNELSVFTCEDLYDQINQVSLTLAGLVVKLLKGHEIELNRRAVLLTEELVLPSLSGLPLKLGVNMTSLLSLRLKGNVNYREASHFSLTGYVKPSAYVGLSARMGVDSVLGQAALDWVSELSSSTSLDGSVQLQEGRDVRVMLNTPEDVMNIISFSSRVFQLSGDHREEIKGAKSQTQKITCTPKTWSKIVGWQLCSNASYPFPAAGILLPAVGPVHLSVKLLKLDRGLHYYLLEAAYSLLPQRGTWFPREASIHLLLASPQSSVSRDMSLDFAFNPHRLLLRIMHPLKTIHIQGQLEQEKSIKSGKLELIIDGVHYYIMGLSDTQTFMSEQRTRYHLEAKMAGDGDPMILSANTTRELGRKMSVSASVKNVFRETASMSVSLERRRDGNSRQYSVEVEFLLPGMVSSRMLGLMEQKGSLWSSALRLKYGLGEDARHLRQECFVSQRLKSERDSNFTYIMRADHEFFCSSTAPINHKIQLRHEESPRRINSALHMSYGKHWDEINNKRTVLLSQSFKNQSTQNHTSYTLEFIFKVPEKNLNYRTQLLHTHLRDVGSESSSHLKINYNDLTPLVAGLHWKSPPADGVHKKWEGMFNLDTPWLYMYTTHKLSHLQRHTLQLTSELTARKWLTIRNLILEGFYRDRGREREARLQLYTPAVTYLQAEGRGVVGKRSVKASCSFSSLWTPPLGGEVSLEASKLSQSLQMASSYAQHNVSLAAVLNTVEKNLKKRQALVKMTFSRPKSPSTELEFEGTVEELRKDKRMYQKTAVLHLRQPFQTFPQTFLLRETFTVDLLKGLYILESKIALPGNREVIHTLTLGYKPPSPFVCSALVHPFLSDTFPSDSEICVTITSNKTQRNVHGRLRVGSKDRLSFFGQVYSNHQVLNIRANFTQQLKLQLPSFAIMEGDVCWNPENNTDFDYQARGKLRIERQECKLSVQVNGTSDGVGLYSSLSHPFKSNIPKTLEVKATVNTAAGKGSSLVHVKADGKDRVKLDAQMSHSHRREIRALGLRMNLSQSLLPTATDLHVNMATNISSDSVSVHGSYTQGNELLHLQVKGSLENTQGRQLAVSGDLRHSMANLQILPPAVGLDGVLEQSDTLVQGHLRVKAMETLYSVELRHQEDPAEALYTQDKEVLGKMSSGAYDWLAVHLGEEYMFVNVSHQLRNQGRGEVYTHLSHSFHQLNHTGLPANISGQVRWTQDGGQLSLLAHLQAGPEYLKAQLDGAKTDHLIPRWEYSCGLQHQVNALLTRGLSSSIQAKAHHQLTTGGLDIGLIFHINDKRMAHVVFNIGSRNSTSTAVVSLWQQIQLLQGLIPTYLQMNCTGDATAERLSAQCYGNVEGHPVEVQGFRSYRPHNRLCYGLSFTHLSLSAQAKGCYSSNGQKELRANLTHSTVLLLTHLGLPTKSAVRLLLRPGPRRWALGIGLVGGPRRTHLNVGLRLERPGLYSCHGLLEYGTRSITHRAEVTGRMRVESWCHVWADVTVAWDSVSSSLLVSVRCTGVGRLVWQQVRSNEGGAPYKTFLTVHGQAGKDGLRGSLGLENHQDSLQCLLSVLLKEQKGEVSWTLQHHWTSLASIIPNRVDLQGSCLLHDASLSGRVRFSISNHSAEVDVAAAWQPSTSFRATFKKNSPGFPEGELTVRLSAMANQAQFEVKSDVCSVLLLANRHRGREDNRTSWTFFVQQRCGLLKSLVSRQTSVNVSMVRSGCSTNLSTILQVDSEEKGSLILHLTCLTGLSLKASVQHSIKAVQTLGFPSFGSLTLNVPSSHLSGVDVGLELGRCYFRSKLAKETRETDGNESLYAVNVTNLCPALQGTVLPVSLVLRGLLSVSTCQMMVTSSLNVDNHDLTLDLVQSCRPWHLSGNLTHSFPDLRSRGLPHIISMEASAPGRPEQRGTRVLIKAGTCHIRASRVMEARGGPQWLWALESKCPLLQVQVNGSVWQDSEGIWTTMLDADLEGQRGFLRMKAKPWPEPSVEGQLLHNILALRGLPKNSRLTVTGRAGKQRYNTDAVLQMDGCAVSVSGAAMSYSGLQGSVVYHNNCTLLQAWNSPDMIHASGLLAVSPTFAESQVSMAIDEIELQTTLALKKTKDKNEASLHLNHTVPLLKKLGLPTKAKVTLNSGSGSNGSFFYTFNSSAGNQNIIQEMMASKTHQTVRVQTHFRHTVNYLKKLGVPGNNSFQVELGSPKGNFTVHSQFGDQQAGLRLKMKCFPMTKEMSGSFWHSWSWLQHRGVPLTVEGFSSIQGVFSQFQSRAQLIVDQHKLVTSGFNVSVGDGRLGLQLSYSPLVSKHTRAQFSLGTALTAHFKGPLRSVSVDVTCRDWRVQVEGDVGGWRAHGGSKEARVTLRHTVQGQISPALQLEAWGRLTESQLRCSMVVNPERSSSLALIIQGHHLPHSKDLMVKVVQNIPKMMLYLPSQLNVHSQLNQSQSSVSGLLEVLSGRRRLWALGDVASIESGYRQALELKHSYPQLKPLPRSVAVRTVYETRKWSYQVQHGAVWGNQEFSLSGLYSAPPALEMGNQTLKVHIKCIPRWTSLEATMENSLQGRLDSVSLGWTRHGRREQVRALSRWSRSEKLNETKFELEQPFSLTLSQLFLHTISRSVQREQRSSHQTHLSWNSAVPVNVSLSLNKQWQVNSSRGQACAMFSTQQMVVSSVKGCVSVAQAGNSYSQNAELRWNNRSVKQGMKYQKSSRGIHKLQVHVGLDNVSPAPCPSHTLLAKVQTNLRDHVEHTVLLGLCPPQPTLSWSGSHRVISGDEVLYTQSRLSVTGHPDQCSLTLALLNSSSSQVTNITLFSESRIGNWSVEVGASALSWPRGSGLQLQATLDRIERVWLNGTIEGQCLHTTAGYMKGPGLFEDLTVMACVGTNHSLMLDVEKSDSSSQSVSLGRLSVGRVDQRLMLKASGCSESLTSAEARVHYLSSRIWNKVFERIKTLQHLLTEFRRQSRDSKVLQELSVVFLHGSQRAEALLSQRDGGLLSLWRNSLLGRTLTESLPRFLSLLQHASLLGQQELRRPLATLAGVYQDVNGHRLETLWRETVLLWTDGLVEVLQGLLGKPHLSPLVQAGVTTFSVALDAAGQHTYHWLETRLATSLSGIRKQLASVYKFSPSDCSVTVSVPISSLLQSKWAEAGLVEILLEEWLLRPLQTLVSIRPSAELNRLKRKLMDSPFKHEALLVADQFVVTFDGHLYELPGSCPLVLAQDVSTDPSFTLLLRSDMRNFLLVEMNNHTISIQPSGQVRTNCNKTVTHTFHSDSGVTVRRALNNVHVTNQNGVSVSCDRSLELCSFTLDGWLHGTSTGLFGINDNEAGNDFPLPDGSQAENMDHFFLSWQMTPECIRPPATTAWSPVSCDSLFSSPDSPLASCFRVVDPAQFMSVCASSSSRAPCRLASAFVHLCQQNYVPLDVPVQCLKV